MIAIVLGMSVSSRQSFPNGASCTLLVFECNLPTQARAEPSRAPWGVSGAPFDRIGLLSPYHPYGDAPRFDDLRVPRHTRLYPESESKPETPQKCHTDTLKKRRMTVDFRNGDFVGHTRFDSMAQGGEA